MDEIVNKLLLAGDKFVPEMHLKQPGYTYIACGPFSKNKERIPKFIETLDSYCVLLTFSVNMLMSFLWKIRKGVSIVDAFQKILDDSDRKPKKIWID